MNHNILLSKVITNATEEAWSQAYSTLNFYITLSFLQEKTENEKEPIAVFGKEILERIQREFFALDEKTLESVKKAVETVTENISKDYTFSIVLVTIVQEMLYIVIASGGHVIIKRGDKIGTIATGESGKVTAFSGALKADDIVLLETEDFSKKIPVDKLSPLLEANVSEISENLAPLIHDSSNGTEAAMILQYKSSSGAAPTEEEDQEEILVQKPAATEKPEEKTEEPQSEEPKISEPETPALPPKDTTNSKLSFLSGKRNLIIIGIVLLVAILGISIFFESNRREAAKRQAIYNEKVAPLEKKFDDATTLTGLNKALGLESLTGIKSSLDEIKTTFAKNTPEAKKANEFYDKVVAKIAEFEAASSLQNQKVFFDPAKEDIKNVSHVTVKGKTITAVNGKTGVAALIDSDGKVTKSIENEIEDIKSLSADATTIYALAKDGVVTIDKKSGKKTITIPGIASDNLNLDTFLGNVYTLNIKDSTIDKYTSGSSAKKAYFTEDIELSDPSSLSIDSSIWVVENGGKVRKFTKGKEDTFSVSGLSKPLGSNSIIYTDQDYSNVYILDGANNRLIEIAKTGELKNQYSSKDLSGVTSFAIDETGKKGYFVSSGKINSFDLQ